MDRESALTRLPKSYRVALTLRDRGLSHDAIAEELGIAVEAVGPCIEVAEAKLATLLSLDAEPFVIPVVDGTPV